MVKPQTVEEQIRKSIGMRERDQHDAMLDFGVYKITAEKLKSISDESRELFVKDLLRILTASNREARAEEAELWNSKLQSILGKNYVKIKGSLLPYHLQDRISAIQTEIDDFIKARLSKLRGQG